MGDKAGSGRSSRLLVGDSKETYKNHVDEAQDYVEDLKTLVSLIKESMGDKRYVACHSMGCAIFFAYLVQEFKAGQPQTFTAAAANAPLLQPRTDPFPYWVAKLIGAAQSAIGAGTM